MGSCKTLGVHVLRALFLLSALLLSFCCVSALLKSHTIKERIFSFPASGDCSSFKMNNICKLELHIFIRLSHSVKKRASYAMKNIMSSFYMNNITNLWISIFLHVICRVFTFYSLSLSTNSSTLCYLWLYFTGKCVPLPLCRGFQTVRFFSV